MLWVTLSSFCSEERKTRLELATPTLARLCSTNWAISALSWAGTDSNCRSREATDLQSARFNHLPTDPVHWLSPDGDSCGIQTHNLLIRSQMLYSVELRSHYHFLGGRWGIRTPDPLLVRQTLWTSWAKRPIRCQQSISLDASLANCGAKIRQFLETKKGKGEKLPVSSRNVCGNDHKA